ncbi:MAG: FAD-binding oxidoreductase [Gammaproteobacteria bacterium]|nr:FAD-binding oxidoreductase [Gammaproteobacteria bacterium]
MTRSSNQGSADVVIVGGGIAGIATAYYLGRAGVKSIVIDRDGIGGHASGYAYGGLSPLAGAGIPGPMFSMAKKSFDKHMELAESLPEETGCDFEFRARPAVNLAFTEKEALQIAEGLEWKNQQKSFSARWMDPDELSSVDPRIAPEALGAELVQGMAEVEPRKFVTALCAGAEKMGVSVRRGTAVGLVRSGDKVVGVELQDGNIACETVVLAQGPWIGESSSWLGVDVGVTPLKGQILRLETAQPRLDCTFAWSGNYATTKADGLLWVGTTEEPVGFDETPTADAAQAILAGLRKMLPSVEGKVVKHTACLRPMSRDGCVLLGAIDAAEGVYIATGGGRKGILYGPGMGSTLADLITTGTSDLDMTRYDPGRSASVASPQEPR